jgi:DtxR family Mn-dependent transcriptional regulator
MSQEQATVAEEEYLQIIYWLQEAGLPMTGANIARAMQVSAPTVHEMIGRLEDDGYVTRADDKSLSFTKSGLGHAAQIVRRHRLIERFLTDVFDIPWDQVHEEAEKLEHWMSPVVEERMLRAIGDAKTCPHGHPIFEGEREEGVPLADVEEGARVRVLRFENEAEDLHYPDTPDLRSQDAGTRGRRQTWRVDRRLAPSPGVVAGDGVGRGRPTPPPRTSRPDRFCARQRARWPVSAGVSIRRWPWRAAEHAGGLRCTVGEPGGAASRRRRAARSAGHCPTREPTANGRRRPVARGGAGASLQRRGHATSCGLARSDSATEAAIPDG